MMHRTKEQEAMTRAVIYARYSSDNQRDASIEDQVRQCRARIEQEGWRLEAVYSDHAISGATTLRPGYQRMLEGARNWRRGTGILNNELLYRQVGLESPAVRQGSKHRTASGATQPR